MPSFLDKSWMHLGDEHDPNPYTLKKLRAYPLPVLARAALKKVFRRRTTGGPPASADLYTSTNFRPWVYRKGEGLPFEDGTVKYVFSEHFFMALFMDEAMDLLRECGRVLAPGGVIRTVVSDADLRTYEPPEVVGYPRKSLPFTDYRKSRTRYSVYMLEEMLRLVGLRPIPVRYCDLKGNYIRKVPADLRGEYTGCADPDIVMDFSHVSRPDSLIVDGLKVV